MAKAELHLVGQTVGPPTFEDLVSLFKSLTGRDPTPEELAEAREEFDLHATSAAMRHDLGGPGSGNFGHSGRPGEVGGSSSDGDSGTGRTVTREQVRHEFDAMIKTRDQQNDHVNDLRVKVNAAWNKWGEDLKNHKPHPLKPDGVAAKKLPSYQEAKAIETEFHAAYTDQTNREYKMQAAARELLKVPVDDRSKVVFKEDDKAPLLHPAVANHAMKALSVFRQFDGSGAFVPISFPAEKVDDFKRIFGDDTMLDQNRDGSYSLPVRLSLEKSDNGRAHATLTGVALGGGPTLEHQVFHEVAHHIELRNHAVKEAAIALRDKLADAPRQVYPLKTINPALGDDEMALRGRFPDPYSGKIYPDDIATEMVSTGVEAYLTDPVRFAKERPEHFQFIFDVMHGKYR